MREKLDPAFLREVERGYREDLRRLELLLEEVSRLLESCRDEPLEQQE